MTSRTVARQLERLRRLPAATASYDPEVLPPPARRYLERALGSRRSAACGVRLRMTGSVVQSGRRLPLRATEVLVPGRGFHWRARARLGPLVVTVNDHYYDRSSRVDVRLFGVLPVGGEGGPDTTASSRGRLAAESIWAPSMLAPRPGVQWTEVDDVSAVVHLAIDGTEESLAVRVDEDGHLVEVSMHRWGDVGVAAHEALPYGFRVLANGEFDGYTIPTRLEGGWWFGTDRYQDESASRFTITQAVFD